MCILLVSSIVFAAGGYFFLSDRNAYSCKDCNVILISLGNTGANHMSLYGYERDTTPRLNEWAKDAVVFENAFTQSSWTLPVITSVFTSLYPYTHTIIDRKATNVLDPDIPTFPEILQNNGFKTAAFTGGLDYYPLFSYMRGIDDFEINPPFTGFDITLPQAEDWIGKNRNNRFFLLIHGYDTHCPFTPPDELRGVFSDRANKPALSNEDVCFRGFREKEGDIYEVYYFKNKTENRAPNASPIVQFYLTQENARYLEDLYDEEVLAVDQKVVHFLESLSNEILDKTVIIIFSDHGEMFGRNGRFGRAGSIRGTLYDDVLKVPLVIKIPNTTGKRVVELAQLIDIMPTLMDILGIDISRNRIQGQNLRGIMKGEKNVLHNKFSYTGTVFGRFNNERVRTFYENKTVNESIRNVEWKLIRELVFDESDNVIEETYELYDIVNDPRELIDRKNEEPIILRQLQSKLRKWRTEALAFFEETDSQTQDIPDELIEAARERGYW